MLDLDSVRGKPDYVQVAEGGGVLILFANWVAELLDFDGARQLGDLRGRKPQPARSGDRLDERDSNGT